MELKVPNEAEKAATAKAFANLSNVLKAAWHQGGNASAVAAAIQWADNAVNFFNTPDLKVVPNDPTNQSE